MPVALSSDVERIAESFVNRGLGTSGVARRRIQQELLKRGRGLQQSLATARGILRRNEMERRAKFGAQIAEQRMNLTRESLDRKTNALRPYGGPETVRIGTQLPQVGRSQAGVGGGMPSAQLVRSGQNLLIRVPGVGGIVVRDPQEARQKLAEMGLEGRVNLITDPSIISGQPEKAGEDIIARAERAGFQVTSRQFRSPEGRMPGFKPNERQMAAMPTAPSPAQQAVETLKTTPKTFNISQVDANTRARLISGALGVLNRNQNLSTIGLAGRDALIGALQMGSGASTVVQDLIREGIVNAAELGF